MKIETAIENLQVMIDCNEKYEAFLAGEDDSDEDLRDTELTLETLRMAKRALEEKSRWIPCSERMPEMYEFTYCTDDDAVESSGVVLFCDHNSAHTGYYESAETTEGTVVRARWYTEDGEPCDGVTAWAPLPEVYEED